MPEMDVLACRTNKYYRIESRVKLSLLLVLITCNYFTLSTAAVIDEYCQLSPHSKKPTSYCAYWNVEYGTKPCCPIRDEHSLDNVLNNNSKEEIYAIVIDAGSTGSRIHVYKFLNYTGEEGKSELKLEEELFEEVQPGLSAYGENPNEARLGMRQLVSLAKEYVPPRVWEAGIPATLRATAGLRALPDEIAEEILHQVYVELHSTELKICDSCISIMEGNDEGIMSWLTVNYLAGKDGDTIGIMDLGGGSTQITYHPSDVGLPVSSHHTTANQLKLLSMRHKLETQSYLGLGLMSFRAKLFEMETDNDTRNGDEVRVKSSCLPAEEAEVTWVHGKTRSLSEMC